MSPVNLGFPLSGVSTNIEPEGITLHYGGPSHWNGANRKSGALFAKSTNHKRCPTVVRSWHSYHLSKGWAALAYTSVVCPHGTVYEGRGKGRRTAANGTSEGNLRSYAVCYLAGDDDPLTDEAKRAFLSEQKRLVTKLRWVHRQWKDTDCPGKPIEAWKATGWRAPTTTPTTTSGAVLDMATMSEKQLRHIIADEFGRSSMRALLGEYGTLEDPNDGYGEVATAGIRQAIQRIEASQKRVESSQVRVEAALKRIEQKL